MSTDARLPGERFTSVANQAKRSLDLPTLSEGIAQALHFNLEKPHRVRESGLARRRDDPIGSPVTARAAFAARHAAP